MAFAPLLASVLALGVMPADSFAGLPSSAVSGADARRRFVFPGIPEGSYRLVVTHLGYESIVRRVRTDTAGAGVDVSLRASALPAEPIVVTATGVARSGDNLTTPEGGLGNTGYRAFNGRAAVGLHGSWGSLTLRYARHQGDFELLEAGEEPREPIGVEVKDMFQSHFTGEVPPAAEEGAEGGQGEEGEEFEFAFRTNTGTGRALFHHRQGENASATYGLSGQLKDTESESEIQIIPDGRLGGAAGRALPDRDGPCAQRDEQRLP